MVLGALISLVGSVLFAAATTNPDTSYDTFVLCFVLMSGGGGMAFVAWMASFTETVEKHNPAATATGLAVFGWIIRIALMLTLVALPAVVPVTTTLVDKAPRVQEIVEKYPQQVKVLQTVEPATLTALKSDPNDKAAQAQALSALSGLSTAEVGKVVALGAKPQPELATAPKSELAFLQANGPKVEKAAAQLKAVSTVPPADLAYLGANAPKVAEAVKDGPGQWQTWWWICIIGQLLFIPVVFVLSGRWSPRKARQDEAEYERRVALELAKLADKPAVGR
jgi:ACS family D-galactonate transporter-like MFS transporter